MSRTRFGAVLALAALAATAAFAEGDSDTGPIGDAGLSAASSPATGGALDLGAAIQESLGRSPDYRRAQAAASEKDWARLEAASAFLPKVSLDGTRFVEDHYQVVPVNFFGDAVAFPEVMPYFQYGFDASWTLFDGWNGVNTLRASDSASQAADLDSDWALFKLRQDIRLKFYEALAARKLERLSDENVRTLKDHLRIVKDLLVNGRATRFDLLRVEVELDDALTGQLEAQNTAALARRALARAMGEEGDGRPLVGNLPEPQAAPSGGAEADEKPDVKARFLRAEAARQAGLAAAAHWLPRLSVIASYQWYDNGYDPETAQMDPGDTSAHGTDYDLGLSLSWELFNGGGSLARQMEASRRAQEAEEDARKARLDAVYDRDQWRRRLDYSTKLYRARLDDVDKARESVRLAKDGLQAGTRTTTEVLDAELDAFRAEAGVVSAQLDAAEAFINLELALGTGDLS